MVGTMRKLLLPMLIALLAAFAPPERGLRYVFEISYTGQQTKTIELMRKRAELAGIEAIVLPVEANRIEVRVPYGTSHPKLVRMMTWPGIMSFNMVDTSANAAEYPILEERNGRVSLEMLSPNGAPLVIERDPILGNRDVANTRTMTDGL